MFSPLSALPWPAEIQKDLKHLWLVPFLTIILGAESGEVGENPAMIHRDGFDSEMTGSEDPMSVGDN